MRANAAALNAAGRVTATALVVAPLAWALALFLADLHERPDGRRAFPLADAGVELPVGTPRSVAIPLAVDSVPYRAVAARFRAAAPAQVTLRLCAPSSCNDRALEVGNGEVALLPVPSSAAAGGDVLTLTVTAISGGPVALRGDSATPAIEVVQGHSWRLPARRAREVFHALAGADLFFAALGACALALAAAFAACLVVAMRTQDSGI